MSEVLLDTDIISLYLRGESKVCRHVEQHIRRSGTMATSIISHYEIVSGLMHRDAHRQLESFLAFEQTVTVLPVTRDTSLESSAIYAELRKTGRIIDDADILIAGICRAYGMPLITNNEAHFNRIRGLKVMNWNK